MTITDTIAWTLCTAAIPAAWWLWQRDIIRAGSFRRLSAGGRERNLAGVPAPTWLLGAFVLYLGVGVFAAIASSLPQSISGEPDSIQRRAVTSIVGYGAAAVIGIAIVHLLRAGAGRLSTDPDEPATKLEGLRWCSKDMLIGVGCLALLAPFYQLTATLSTAAATWFSGEPPPLLAHDSLTRIVEHRTDPWVWALAAALVIGPPIVEELIYRVFIQSALIGLFQRLTLRTSATWPAILISSALFALMHVAAGGPVPWHAAPGLFVLSLGLGIAYERAARRGGGPLTPIVMHMAFNAINMTLALSTSRA